MKSMRESFAWKGVLAALVFVPVLPLAAQLNSDTLVITSTNNATANDIVVFKLNTGGTPSLSMEAMLPTGGAGGASGNGGAVQFSDPFGAVVNYGSNSVSQLVRYGNSIAVAGTIPLAQGCLSPVSVALSRSLLYVAGANCAESHTWPFGNSVGAVVPISDNSAGQIVVGSTWAAVTLKSGSVLELPLASGGRLAGSSSSITLPSSANNTPLGAAFWGNVLGFNPAHSPDSFALVNSKGTVFPVLGPQPAYPTNAPCWLAKGPGNIWYAGNSPGEAISIFFSDAQGGVFYKSVQLPGSPTDISVSPDGKWLAVIYSASGNGYVAVFSIDAYGDLSPVATSSPIGIPGFSGVAFSQ